LISFNETFATLMDSAQIEQLMRSKIHFMDITDYPSPVKGKELAFAPVPTQPEHKEYVQTILPTLSANQITSTITTLSNYFTRFYTTTTGAQAATWLRDQYVGYAAGRSDVSVQLFTHTWAQPSVIATILGRGPNKDEVVILGGHEDSTAGGANSRSPGADDDASGSATVLEVFRALMVNGYVPDRTVKFMAYAAEEAGLLGSQAIANQHRTQGVVVHGALQLDMTGYNPSATLGVVSDFTDLALNNFVKILIDTYTVVTWTNTVCGYACSDHASWNRAGYRSSFPFETAFGSHNPYIHTANDVLANLNANKMLEVSKMATGFVVEMAGRADM